MSSLNYPQMPVEDARCLKFQGLKYLCVLDIPPKVTGHDFCFVTWTSNRQIAIMG